MRRRFAITLLAVMLAAISLTVTAVTLAGSPPAPCQLSAKTMQPGTISVLNVEGPSYVDVYVNYENPDFKGAFWNPGKQPPWDQQEVKVRVDRGIQVKLYGIGGQHFRYRKTAACQEEMVTSFQADGYPARSLNDLEQWGIVTWFRVGR